MTMLLATPHTLGRHGYERALRHGQLRQLLPGVATPLDVGPSAGVRALAIANVVPRRGIVTGLAGLWIHTGTHPTVTIDVIGSRAMHRPDARPGSRLRVRTHVAVADAAPLAPGVAVADALRCCADALRFSAPRHAFAPVDAFLAHDRDALEAVAALVAAVPRARRHGADAVVEALRSVACRRAALAARHSPDDGGPPPVVTRADRASWGLGSAA